MIAFSGRILNSEAQGGKYVNSPETPLFSKGNILFGLYQSKRFIANARQAIVLEGQLDLITSFEAGIQNVVAPQGTALTERHAALLRRFAEEVILFFDADSAGQKAAERAMEILFGAGLQVKIGELPAGEDPDSLIRKSGGDAFRARVEKAEDFFVFPNKSQSGRSRIDNNRWQGRLRAEDVTIYRCCARSRRTGCASHPAGSSSQDSARHPPADDPFAGHAFAGQTGGRRSYNELRSDTAA